MKSNDWQSMYINMAKADPKLRFTTLAHRLTPEFLYDALKSLNRNAAPGPDGLTVQEYERDVIPRIKSLHQRMVRGSYRASPVRRVFIPKPNGKLRPLGIANVEDRMVQTAIKNLLEPIYEQDFLDFSYGYRPGRSAHDALKALRQCIQRRRIRYVVEADIKGFFDNIEHKTLLMFLGHRIADRGLRRLIAKFLNAGIVEEDGTIQRPSTGTPQGGPLSPLLANIYLHYALDLWFDRRFRRTCTGAVEMVRYADDFVVCFERREEAESFIQAVGQRLAEFGLELEPAKTRLIEFGREMSPPGPGPKSGQHTFDFLGFTFYLRRSKARRRPQVGWKPSAKSRTRFLARLKEWLRKHRHYSGPAQRHALNRKLQGFYGYFNLKYCRYTLLHVRFLAMRLWKGALDRRSQRGRKSWIGVQRKPWFRLVDPERRRRPKKKRKSGTVPKQMTLDFGSPMPSR